MTFNAILSFAGAVLSGGLAAFVFFRDSRSFVHRAFAAGMTALALMELFTGMGARAPLLGEMLRWERYSLIASALLPGSWFLFSLSFARSNYRELLQKWKWLSAASFVFPLVLAAFFRDHLFAELLDPGNSPSLSSIRLGWAGYLFYLFYLLMSVIILMNLEETLRASSGTKRWQIKFMILGIGGLFSFEIYTTSQALLFSSASLGMQSVNSCSVLAADLLMILSLARNRMLDAKIHLSRTFLYNSITVTVAGIYLLAVGVLANAIGRFGGGHVIPLGTFFVFIALLGLAIVFLSDELRQRIKRYISRNFYRSHYDYRKEWMAFTQRTTSLVEMRELCAAVSRMIAETFGVSSVSIWLLGESPEEIALGGSTCFTEVDARRLQSFGAPWDELISSLRGQHLPIDFNTSLERGAKRLQESYPTFLRNVRIRYGVSLVAGQQLLGVMTLNDRFTKEPFSVEDADLLKTIADQTAGSLLNLKLSDRLLKAKEREAFQTLSTFFIHDLKNLASMLSLTMQNLPSHYDNPDFRSDALRVISQSVAKMNAMCSKLSLLTKELKLQQSETDLNELVNATLTGLNGSKEVSLIRRLGPLPQVSIDPEQIQKVILNLILNAKEAVGGEGEIRIETEQVEGWAVLSVSDNGCGISREFLSKSLFQPFQTTKSEGLGIGLFHTKKIIEAHRGRIEVESEEGVGTTFRVMLPLYRSNGTKSQV